MSMENNEIVDEISSVRNHSPQSKRTYLQAVNLYSEFNQMSMQDLIEEAEDEEERGIRWKHRKLKKRLITFRKYLIENYKKNTLMLYFLVIKSVYKHYDIEIHDLPKISSYNMQLPTPITYSDILTHDEINLVLENVNLTFKAIILFMTSSGCARTETMNLTVNDYIEATMQYHDRQSVYDALQILNETSFVVPTFKLWRQKTHRYYYTFCSPEAVKTINNYLLSDRSDLKGDEPLFNISKDYLPVVLSKLNNELGLGSAGTYNRLRTHMFRKFHASNLLKAGMSESEIDALQRRGKTTVRQSYFYDDPNNLRKKYIKSLPFISINTTINRLDFKSEQYIELKKENRLLKNDLRSIKREINEIKNWFD